MSAERLTRPQAVETARRMWDGGEGGWTITEIRNYLAERGLPVCAETVRRWVDPEWADRFYERRREQQRRRDRVRRGTTEFRVIDEHALDQLAEAVGPVQAPAESSPELLLALRVEDGLSYGAIAKVARRFFGERLTEHQVQKRLRKLGAPKNPNKARPPRRRQELTA